MARSSDDPVARTAARRFRNRRRGRVGCSRIVSEDLRGELRHDDAFFGEATQADSSSHGRAQRSRAAASPATDPDATQAPFRLLAVDPA
jgi:hypothetical protein